jgi:hypothetical protein
MGDNLPRGRSGEREANAEALFELAACLALELAVAGTPSRHDDGDQRCGAAGGAVIHNVHGSDLRGVKTPSTLPRVR